MRSWIWIGCVLLGMAVAYRSPVMAQNCSFYSAQAAFAMPESEVLESNPSIRVHCTMAREGFVAASAQVNWVRFRLDIPGDPTEDLLPIRIPATVSDPRANTLAFFLKKQTPELLREEYIGQAVRDAIGKRLFRRGYRSLSKKQKDEVHKIFSEIQLFVTDVVPSPDEKIYRSADRKGDGMAVGGDPALKEMPAPAYNCSINQNDGEFFLLRRSGGGCAATVCFADVTCEQYNLPKRIPVTCSANKDGSCPSLQTCMTDPKNPWTITMPTASKPRVKGAPTTGTLGTRQRPVSGPAAR